MKADVLEFNAPGPVAEAYLQDLQNIVQIIRGPIGSGKTTTSLFKLIWMAMMQTPNTKGVRNTRWFIFRRTYEDLRKTTFSDWNEQWAELLPFRHPLQSPMSDRWRFTMADGTKVDARFEFVALDREEDIERVRGSNYTGGLGNELKQCLLSHIEALMGRCGRFPSKAQGGVLCDPDLAIIIGDTNSPDDDHWLYSMEQEPRRRWKFYVQPPAVIKLSPAEIESVTEAQFQAMNENQQAAHAKGYRFNEETENIANLPPDYYSKQLDSFSPDRIEADLANNFVMQQTGKPVYPEYYELRHCSKGVTPDPNLPLLLGADGGLWPSLVICQLSPRGQLRVIDELQSEDKGVFQFWRDVARPHLISKYAGFDIEYCYFDPAGGYRGEQGAMNSIALLNDEYYVPPEEYVSKDYEVGDKFIVVEKLDLWFTVEAAPTNDIELRTNAVRNFLTRDIDGRAGLLVAHHCRNLRKGFVGHYKYLRIQATGTHRYRDKPDKGAYSHMADALQYAALGVTLGAIEQPKDPLSTRGRALPRQRMSRTGY